MNLENKNEVSTTPTKAVEIENSQNISMNEFLEFLKISCYVNDSILFGDTGNKKEGIDYNKLANNEMVNGILNNQFKNNDQIPDGTGSVKSDGDSSSIGGAGDELRRTRRKASLTNTKQMGTTKPIGKGIHPILQKKLDEVMNEGILDSVLPFICPSHAAHSMQQSNNANQLNLKGFKTKVREVSPAAVNNLKFNSNTNVLNATQDQDKNIAPKVETTPPTPTPPAEIQTVKIKEPRTSSRRKSSVLSAGLHSGVEDKKGDSDVIIHVCDEVKSTSKDFVCTQSLLVSKMGYFADVTAGQKLEDMDISVHCDIQIFDWLMKWVKKSPNLDDACPQLDATNVVQILVSASFLQMEPLLLDCLSFCHSRLNDVVRSSSNLSCLNDAIITRLAAMFTNLELEMVKDKKERVTPRLWTKLIQSLCEPEPQALRGHYFSLAGIFRCSKCGKIITQTVASYVCCHSSNMRLNRWGQLVSTHTRDTTWEITTYIASLFKELKSWRKVYWKLWGHCHFLFCCICETHFPAYQMTWCQYHPEGPQFLGPVTEGRIAGPAGRYACCGQQAFRYESLPGPNGCHHREHSVLVETDRDRAILTLAQIAAEGGCLFDPPVISKVQGNSAVFEPRWTGMCLMPSKCRQGLLPPLHVEEFHAKLARRMRQGASYFADSSTDTDTSDTSDRLNRKYHNRQCSTSSDGCESESSSPKASYRNKGIRRQPKTSGRYWSGEMSARSNQDNQREFEEKVMKQVISIVGKKTGIDMSTTNSNNQGGGIYVRLENEWKEQFKQRNFCKPKPK